jgi:predicted transcriptional regulator
LVGPRAKISWPQSKLSCRQGAINMTITTTLKVGIASLEQYKVRTVAIARG